MLDEVPVRNRHARLEERLDCFRVAANFALGVFLVAEREKVHQAAGVKRPEELGHDPDRQDAAGDFAGDTIGQHRLVSGVRSAVGLFHRRTRAIGYVGRDALERVRARLADLRADIFDGGDVKRVVDLGVAAR